MKITNILGVKINHELTINDAVSLIETKLNENVFFQICTTNPEFIIDAQKDAEFKNIINRSFLSLADGSGVVFALEYLERVNSLKSKRFFPMRSFIAGLSLFAKTGKFTDYPPIYGVDLTQQLIKLCADKGYTVGLLGGCPKDKWGRSINTNTNVAKEAANVLCMQYPNLKVVFAESDVQANATYDTANISLINNTLVKANTPKIDVLLVAFGHGKQEKWIQRNKSKIPVNLCIGVGGTLDDIAGYTSTPHEFYSQNNLRWLFRLIHQPWRFKRILKATLLFPFLVFVVTLKQQ